MPDPFAAGSVDQPVRVLVVSTTGESAGMRFHMGWRGTVTKVHPSGQVRVNFAYMKEGKVAHKTASISREHLQILTEDDISMTPNQHPWVGQRVAVEEGSGEVLHVTDQGKVKIRIAQDDSKRKKIVFVESRGATFEALFNSNASTAESPPEAVPKQQATEEESEQHVEPREAISVADSDGENEAGPAPSRLHDSDDEPIVPAAKRRRQGAEKKTKANAQRKRPSAASAQPSQPKRRVRRKVASAGQDVD